jgi:drug/metabolite transporter (DMT)-like permease
MSSLPSWFIYAIISILCWGISSVVLIPVSKTIPVPVISVGYGGILVISNFLYIIFTNGVDGFYSLAQGTLILNYMGYIILSVVANFVNLQGYTLASPQSATGVYTAICSTYPLVTLIVAYCFAGQTQLKLELVIPGMFMIIGGVILLILGQSKS